MIRRGKNFGASFLRGDKRRGKYVNRDSGIAASNVSDG